MSKKNNKARHRQYVERLKQKETESARERIQKQRQKDVNRIANDMLDDIQKININQDEEEDDNDKMDVDVKPPTRAKKRKAYRHRKSKRFG